MGDQGNKLDPMSFTGNVANNWKLWKQKFEIYILASGKSDKTEAIKIATLLHMLGDEGIQIYNTFEYEEGEDQTKLNVVMGKFDKYCNPLRNIVYEHYKFFKRDQLPGETIDQFITALRQLASTCEFKEKDVLIMDRIVLGIRNMKIQEKLLEHGKLELNQAIDICRSMESSHSTQREITKDSTNISSINTKYKDNKCFVRKKTENPGGQQRKLSNIDSSRQVYSKTRELHKGNVLFTCYKCGQEHNKGNCPAYNRICSLCKIRGHYRKFCKNKSNIHIVTERSDNHEQDSCSSTDECNSNSKIVWSISNPCSSTEWAENILVNGYKLELKIDSGSEVNILNLNDFSKLNICKRQIRWSNSNLFSYTGHSIIILGQIYLDCKYKDTCKKLLFHVLDSKSPKSLLGLTALYDLNIINKKIVKNVTATIDTTNDSWQQILNKNKTVFEGIGKINKQYNITLKDDSIPFVSAPRKIPIALKNRVKEKLDKMVSENIIVPVTEPTDWVNPIVVVPKSNGDIRICMDPRNLNKYVKREFFQIPTQDYLFSQLTGARYFTLLDASSAFLQIPLTYESSLLCTITTIFGRYRYLRLPYGLSAAPEIFQRFMHDTLSDIPGVIFYFDDILIFGNNEKEHNKNLSNVLRKIKSSGLTLNLEKSKICVTTVKFLGHIINADGISPDETKVQAIKEMKPPKCKKDLQRFLGMITYLAKFIPNLSQETSMLRKLLSERVQWVWTANEESSFNRLKQLVSQKTILAYFDPNKETTLSVDASPYGIGTMISQDGKPIEFASASLNTTQQRYNHIEKELLALVYGCERFHYYLYGCSFTLETDHRPLLGLLKKPLEDMSPRIQRLAYRLLRYQFTLQHVPGKNLKIPDTLSREPLPEMIDTNYLDNNLRVFTVISTSKENADRLKKAISQDAILQKVKEYVVQGWPEHKKSVQLDIRKYWDIKNDIFLHQDVLFYRNRLIIPNTLREELLNIIHQSHQGVISCKKRAQEAIYYPGMTRDIEKMVLSCVTCQQYSKSNVREPLIPHPVPTLPWQKIGMDFMALGPLNFIVIVDYYSKFIVINKLISKTADSVVSTLKNIFAIHGLPEEIFSDNGPPFNSKEFYSFARRYNIQLNTSSPHYPRSNGMIERSIQTIKGMLIKAYQSKEDPFLTVLNYNSTPKQNLPAPSTMLMGRRLRTTLPVGVQTLKPMFSTNKFKTELYTKQNVQKTYYDRGTKKLCDLKENQPVLIQNKTREWRPGVVINKSGPNDYIIKSEDDVQYRRNRHHLKPFIKPDDGGKSDANESEDDKSVTDTSVAAQNLGNVTHDLLNPLHISQDVPTSYNNPQIKTRSGRIVKPPNKLDL